MVDIHERTDFELPVEPVEEVRVTYTSGNRDLPLDAPARTIEGSKDYGSAGTIHLIEEQTVAPGLVLTQIVGSMPMEASPHRKTRRKSARAIFEDSKVRFPKIMARLAE